MLTPTDIQNKQFGRTFRGYDRQQVDEFLDQLTLDFQKLSEEKAKLETQVQDLSSQIEEQKRAEKSVEKTLEQAKRLMNDISESAEKRAEIVIRNARLDAQNITQNAKDEASAYRNEAEQMKQKISLFKSSFRNFMNAEISRVDSRADGLFDELENLQNSLPQTHEPEAEADEPFTLEDLTQDIPASEEPDLSKTTVMPHVDRDADLKKTEELLREFDPEIDEPDPDTAEAEEEPAAEAEPEPAGKPEGPAPVSAAEAGFRSFDKDKTIAVSHDELLKELSRSREE